MIRPPALALALLALLAGFPTVAAAGDDDASEKAPPVQDALLVEARRIQERVVATVELVRPAVVSLRVMGPRPEKGKVRRQGVGSGVVVDPRGFVLTNYHVGGWAEEIVVIFAGTRQVAAKVHGRDPGGDLLLLRLEEPGPWPSVDVTPEGCLTPGCWVLAMGNPRGGAGDGRATVTWGAVTALYCLGGGEGRDSLYYGDAVQTDAEINPGNSGGPLFDLSGRLVGINGRIATGHRAGGGAVNANVGFAISADQIRRFLPLLLLGGTVKHGFLGVRLENGGPGSGGPWGADPAPAKVAFVIPDSAAHRAGVRAGDVLVSLDGEEILSMVRLTNLVTSRPAGSRIALKILRGREERVLVFTLDERPGKDF